MNKPTNLAKFKSAKRKAQGRASTMCRRGFHKWEDDASKQFDVKQGKLISRAKCVRCGEMRTLES